MTAMNTGKLIISFDCEGKWGMADRALAQLTAIASEPLHEAYRSILATLRKYEARATFGMVAALCLDRAELSDVLRTTGPLQHASNDWLKHPRAAVEAGDFHGWSEPEMVRMILAEAAHEVCSHGGFHLPYDDSATDAAAIAVDLSLIEHVHQKLGLTSRNLIYPRNVVGHKAAVANAGFVAYREVDPQESLGGIAGRGTRLANEFLNRDITDLRATETDGMSPLRALSPGKFLNAGIGLRGLVSSAMTIRRVRKLIDFAARERRIVHLYSHPHNFISDRAMPHKFDQLLQIASEYRDRGSLEIVTMADEFQIGCRIS